MDSPGRELATGSDPQATAEKEGWVGVSHCLLAGGGESRRPKAVCNLGSGVSYAVAPPSQTTTEPVVKLEMSDAR
jgi:hypothetical protein